MGEMTNDEKTIARAIAENLGMRGDKIASDAGSIAPFLPPHRKNGNELRAKLINSPVDQDEFDITIVVKRRIGYIR